jgi:hypothetical protein
MCCASSSTLGNLQAGACLTDVTQLRVGLAGAHRSSSSIPVHGRWTGRRHRRATACSLPADAAPSAGFAFHGPGRGLSQRVGHRAVTPPSIDSRERCSRLLTLVQASSETATGSLRAPGAPWLRRVKWIGRGGPGRLSRSTGGGPLVVCRDVCVRRGRGHAGARRLPRRR